MNEPNDKKLRELLKKAIPAVADRELRQDLWPRMLRRLDEREIRVPWFDWALLALLAAWFFFNPGVIPALLYCL